jgi:hypothetical protein
MAVAQIPRSRWREFLDSFNRVHRGWLISVHAGSNASAFMHDVPLASVEADEDDIVVCAVRGREHTDHRVSRVAALRLEQTPDGADRQLEIVPESGDIVRVRFRSAIRSELVDGV